MAILGAAFHLNGGGGGGGGGCRNIYVSSIIHCALANAKMRVKALYY